jgi:hypothetical protein
MLKRRHLELGENLPCDDQRLIMKSLVLGGSGLQRQATVQPSALPAYRGASIVYHRSTKLSMDTIVSAGRYQNFVRKTKARVRVGERRCVVHKRHIKLKPN